MYSHYNMHTLLKWRITKKISYWHCSKYLRARSNMIRQTYIPSRCRFQRSNIVSPQLKAFQGYNENTSNDNKDCCSRSIKSLRNCCLFPKKIWCFVLCFHPMMIPIVIASLFQRWFRWRFRWWGNGFPISFRDPMIISQWCGQQSRTCQFHQQRSKLLLV